MSFTYSNASFNFNQSSYWLSGTDGIRIRNLSRDRGTSYAKYAAAPFYVEMMGLEPTLISSSQMRRGANSSTSRSYGHANCFYSRHYKEAQSVEPFMCLSEGTRTLIELLHYFSFPKRVGFRLPSHLVT